MSRLPFLAVTLYSGLALAAGQYQRTSGGGCCSLILFGLFVYVYSSGGAGWLLSIGTAAFPGIFGWFIWRNRDVTLGVRITALVMASLHAFFFVLGIGLVLFASSGAFGRMMQKAGVEKPPAEGTTTPVDLTNVPEDPALGLHPSSTITTDPPGAQVFVDGKERGRTPLDTPLAAGARNEVKVELADYFPALQYRSPNAREHLDVSFTLKPAASLKVTSTPPGAHVLAAMKEVLPRTPGKTGLIDTGETEILVLLDGYQAHRETVTLPQGETVLDVTLEPGVKLSVSSTPDKSDIFVDGAWLGVTPAEVFVAPRGKHTVEVKKETWAPAKKVFPSVAKPAVFVAKLVDTDRVRAQQAVAKARSRYDKVNQTLEKLQWKIEHMANPPESLERQRVTLDRDMEKAAGVLERAEAELKSIEEMRGVTPPVERE